MTQQHLNSAARSLINRCIHQLADDGLDDKERRRYYNIFSKRDVIVQDSALIPPLLSRCFAVNNPRSATSTWLLCLEYFCNIAPINPSQDWVFGLVESINREISVFWKDSSFHGYMAITQSRHHIPSNAFQLFGFFPQASKLEELFSIEGLSKYL